MEYLKNNYSNDKIREIFTCYRRDIFDELYEKNFCINNKKELKSFIDKYFAPNTDLLEQSSELFSHVILYTQMPIRVTRLIVLRICLKDWLI